MLRETALRYWKEQYRDRSGNALAQARRSYYLYADEGLIAESRQDITLDANESVSASAEPAIATQYGPRPDAKFTTGVLFVKTQNSNGGDTVAYYHHDHLQTPIQATDKQGNVVWSAQYNVFGRATITTPSASPDRPTISSDLRLPGQVEDAETGLHYNWHRYYEPGLGRYVTADPIGLLGDINRYAYVRGNPVNWADPKGLRRQTQPYYYPRPFDFLVPGTPENKYWAKKLTQACESITRMFNEANEKEITNSAGDNVKRKLVKDQDELLEEANKAAGGSLDDYVEYKPGWWISPDGKRKIEWNPDGHPSTNEGPHVTIRDFNGTRHSVTEKIFIDGQEEY